MNKAELEKKHLSDLHLLAAEAGVPKYRMLSKRELIDQLAGGNGGSPTAAPAKAEKRGERTDRPRRRRRERPAKAPERERAAKREKAPEPDAAAEPEPEPAPAPP